MFRDGLVRACCSRMHAGGAIDDTFGYKTHGWFTVVPDTGMRAMAVTRSGITVAVGHRGEHPAMFLLDRTGGYLWSDGVGVEAEVISEVKGVATGVLADGDRIVVCVETNGRGFALMGYELTRQVPPQERPVAQRPISRLRTSQSTPAPESAASVAARAACRKLVADSNANMSNANFMMRIHAMNMSTQRF
jgi:hypothetical protein